METTLYITSIGKYFAPNVVDFWGICLSPAAKDAPFFWDQPFSPFWGGPPDHQVYKPDPTPLTLPNWPTGTLLTVGKPNSLSH